jgi:acetyl esterase/lipase
MTPLDPEIGRQWEGVRRLLYGPEGPRLHAGNLAAAREARQRLGRTLAALPGVHHRDIQVPTASGSVTLAVFTYGEVSPDAPLVYWIHGGGMVLGDRFGVEETYPFMVATGAVVVSPEYRLAPEWPAPAPLDDCYDGLMYVLQHPHEVGVTSPRVVLGGTSAGGGLAAAAALRCRDESGPALMGLFLNCPMLDDRMTSDSSRQFDNSILWTRAMNEFGWQSLLGEKWMTEAITSYDAPARAESLANLPPTFIEVGSADLFRDEDVHFAQRIWSAGGDAELHVWPGAIHGFDVIAPKAAVSVEAVHARTNWFRRLLAR